MCVDVSLSIADIVKPHLKAANHHSLVRWTRNIPCYPFYNSRKWRLIGWVAIIPSRSQTQKFVNANFCGQVLKLLHY